MSFLSLFFISSAIFHSILFFSAVAPRVVDILTGRVDTSPLHSISFSLFPLSPPPIKNVVTQRGRVLSYPPFPCVLGFLRIPKRNHHPTLPFLLLHLLPFPLRCQGRGPHSGG